MAASLLSVGEAARRLGVRPRRLSKWLYDYASFSQDYPMLGGRRMIPAERLDALAIELRRHGISAGRILGSSHEEGGDK